MTVPLKKIVEALEEMAPPQFAASWDNTGLQVGSPDAPVASILVALDVTEEVVSEAARKKADLIVAHHPLFFRPLQRIETDTATGRLLGHLLTAGISVYAAHTNLDVAAGGVNDLLGETLGVASWSPLQEGTAQEPRGFGGIGELPRRMRFRQFLDALKSALKTDTVRLIGAPPSGVRRIAFCCGSGAALIPQVVRCRPDLFVTGDIKYHEALCLRMEAIATLDIGHFASEQAIRKSLTQRIRRALRSRLGKTLPVYASRSERDPFSTV